LGYLLDETGFSHLIENLKKSYRIFAPVLKKGQGRHLDTDVVLYDEVNEAGEIELLKKSDYAFKEAMTPLSETLFFFTEKETKLADIDERPVLVFLRSCDLHALRRQDAIYLQNGREKDPFYQRRRELLKFVLIGCQEAYENCFCVDMGSNQTKEGYVFSIDKTKETYRFQVLDPSFLDAFISLSAKEEEVTPFYVTETKTKVEVPDEVPASIIKQIVELSNAARKEGLLALEGTAREMEDKFMQKGLLLVVDGTEPEMVKSVMEAEIDTIDARHKERIQVFEDLAAQGPAWGMIGTLIGLILMLKNMSDPSSIGPSMAVALITTMYGSMLANWVCFPVSTKMKKRNDAEITLKGIIVEGLMSIQAGENPRTTEEKLKSFLSPQQRDAYEAENGSGSAGGE